LFISNKKLKKKKIVIIYRLSETLTLIRGYISSKYLIDILRCNNDGTLWQIIVPNLSVYFRYIIIRTRYPVCCHIIPIVQYWTREDRSNSKCNHNQQVPSLTYIIICARVYVYYNTNNNNTNDLGDRVGKTAVQAAVVTPADSGRVISCAQCFGQGSVTQFWEMELSPRWLRYYY